MSHGWRNTGCKPSPSLPPFPLPPSILTLTSGYSTFSHLDNSGAPQMVDVSLKSSSNRHAVASGKIHLLSNIIHVAQECLCKTFNQWQVQKGYYCYQRKGFIIIDIYHNKGTIIINTATCPIMFNCPVPPVWHWPPRASQQSAAGHWLLEDASNSRFDSWPGTVKSLLPTPHWQHSRWLSELLPKVFSRTAKWGNIGVAM